MTVYLVGAGPGDPGLLTRRAAALLARGRCGPLRPPGPSLRAGARSRRAAELIDVGKTPGRRGRGPRPSGRDRSAPDPPRAAQRDGGPVEGRGSLRVRPRRRRGRRPDAGRGAVGGDPRRLVRLRRPGGRRHSGDPPWPLVVGDGRDRPRSTTRSTAVQWEALAKIDGTLVILMGMMDRAEIADALQRGGKPGSTPTAVIERGTTAEQAVVRTTLDQLAAVTLGSPAVIVVGPVAALGAQRPAAAAAAAVGGPLAGRTVVVDPPGPRAQDLLDALRHTGATTISVALTEQTEAEDGGVALRAAAEDVGQFRLGRLHLGQCRDTVHARAARCPGFRERPWWRRSGRPRPRHCGERASSRIWCPRRACARRLLAEFPDHAPGAPGDEVLFPCADLAPATIPDGLGAKGWRVRRVEAYRTVALPPPDPTVLAPDGAGRCGGLHCFLLGPGVRRAPYARRVAPAGPADGHLHRSDHSRVCERSGHEGSGRGGERADRGHRRRPRPALPRDPRGVDPVH